MARAVCCCSVSMAIVGEAVFEALLREVNDDIKRSAWFLDADRTRELALTPTGGGVGKAVSAVELGLSVNDGNERGNGDRPWCLGAKSGETVVAALTGVP